jgi:hypothetical protein
MAIKETVQIDVQTNADKTADDLTSAIKDLNAAIEKMTGSVSMKVLTNLQRKLNK